MNVFFICFFSSIFSYSPGIGLSWMIDFHNDLKQVEDDRASKLEEIRIRRRIADFDNKTDPKNMFKSESK